ncbi:EAL domain-containing protein [Gymnodinialimonas hymeniacidonis]|uniref:EAL domain-containing protein n=1 Tax=Gymnodinialimonas hymeniacidonis TaxID=3126508 RepID=UPI0034C67AD0
MPVVPYFQPLIRVQTGSFEGLEALARYNRGGRVYAPAKFMNGMKGNPEREAAFDWLMLKRVVENCREWIADGVSFESVGWNVGSGCLGSDSFVEKLSCCLTSIDMDPKALAIEITEAALSGHSYEKKLSNIEAARAFGCKIALDDFGTGGSSLSILRDVPCTAIKIAGEFVDDVLVNWRVAAIVEGIVGVAHSLGVLVVAECVESETQFEAISDLGCDLVQGHFFFEAVPGSRVPNLLDSLKRRNHLEGLNALP